MCYMVSTMYNSSSKCLPKKCFMEIDDSSTTLPTGSPIEITRNKKQEPSTDVSRGFLFLE